MGEIIAWYVLTSGFCVGLGILIGFSIGENSGREDMEKEAVVKGHAEFAVNCHKQICFIWKLKP